MTPRRLTGVSAAVRARGVTLASLIESLPGDLRSCGGTGDVDIDLKGRGPKRSF